MNAIGANHAHKRELDDEVVVGADVIVVDSIEQSRQEAMISSSRFVATKCAGPACVHRRMSWRRNACWRWSR